jgi:cation diffusion facilitator CzcD-associated flavoprotein CzcO
MAGTDVDHVDLAVIGGGAAGTYVAQRVCGEGFSRNQAWVEGALETADAVMTALTERSASTGT